MSILKCALVYQNQLSLTAIQKQAVSKSSNIYITVTITVTNPFIYHVFYYASRIVYSR